MSASWWSSGSLDDAVLLDLADQLDRTGIRKGMVRLVERVCPEIDEPGCLALGTAQYLLIQFRETVFGDRYAFLDSCAECGEPVEFELSGSDFLPPDPPQSLYPQLFEFEHGEFHVEGRTLSLNDWGGAVSRDSSDALEVARNLLQKTVLGIALPGNLMATPEALPLSAWDRLSAEIAERDPWSELLFLLHCPKCQANWESVFEPAAYVSREIDNRARRMLAEVHELAGSYGWAEEAILALGPVRRGHYLQLIRETREAAVPHWKTPSHRRAR